MSLVLSRPDILPPLAELRGAADRILEIQTPDGAIPWFECSTLGTVAKVQLKGVFSAAAAALACAKK